MKALFIVAGLLLASAGAPPVQAGPNAYISHTMWILDQDSFDALAKVDFLKNEFARFSKATVNSGSSSWSAIYMVGEKTQLEFISPNPEFPSGTIGLALGTEDKIGDINTIESQFHSTWDGQEPVIREQRTSTLQGKEIPWFNFVILQLGGGNFRTWVMEYDSKYLETKRPNRPPEYWGITREAYNRIGYKPSLLLKNISSVSLKLDPVLLEQEVKILRALGFLEERNGQIVLLRGPDLTVKMEPGKSGQFEYSEIEMELNRPYTEQTEITLTKELKLVFDQKLPRAVLRRLANNLNQVKFF